MQVKMVARISGTRDGEDWPAPGEILECGDAEGAELLMNQLAVHPDDDVEETATAPDDDVETATPRRGRGKAAVGN